MSFTVKKDAYDKHLKHDLEKAGVHIIKEIRGEERGQWDDVIGTIMPFDSILTDYVNFSTYNRDIAKSVLDNQRETYYDVATEEVHNGCLDGCGLMLLLIVFVPLLIKLGLG